MPAQTRSILLAEDDSLTRRAIRAALLDMGFEVHLAVDGDEGCRKVDELNDGSTPGLLITDIDMPGCDGEELAAYARKRFPGIKVLFMSGAPHPELLESIAGDGNARMIEKPFAPGTLRAVLGGLGVVG